MKFLLSLLQAAILSEMPGQGRQITCYGHLNIRISNLLGIWCLEFGAFSPDILSYVTISPVIRY
ncbi:MULTISPECIES: hypothetical protein [unclassified Wenzhouxiangella]|uniref:hypothetical protein n=1 Tax=unclassified Wenzhouxiangella TaxID=2613841 RepID=UPI0011C01D13|nr:MULTISPECIES: hypothetical protein [unclassified Wenzhouxiangella]